MERGNVPTLTSLAPVPRRPASRGAPLILGAALLLAALLQTGGAIYLPSGAPRPDLVLLVALAWGFRRGGDEGIWAGLAGGALLDLCSSAPFGLHMLTYGTALLVTAGAQTPFAPSFLRRVGGTLLAVTTVHLLSLVLLQTRGWEVWWPAAMVRAILPAIAADTVLFPLCYALLPRPPEPQENGMPLGG
jgi:rod shape-determining protein MreD